MHIRPTSRPTWLTVVPVPMYDGLSAEGLSGLWCVSEPSTSLKVSIEPCSWILLLKLASHNLTYLASTTNFPFCYGHKSPTGPYGVFLTKNRTILRRPYGARPAAGRIVRFFYQFLDIVRCPVKLRHYLKFHGARSAFGRVIEGKMTSTGHRTASGRRLHTSDGHRTIFV